jgi:hypothetical protein
LGRNSNLIAFLLRRRPAGGVVVWQFVEVTRDRVRLVKNNGVAE